MIGLYVQKIMKQRVIKKGDGAHWCITTEEFKKTPDKERKELKDYFDEIRLNYHEVDGDILIDGSVEWKAIQEVMDHFYDDWATFTPF